MSPGNLKCLNKTLPRRKINIKVMEEVPNIKIEYYDDQIHDFFTEETKPETFLQNNN